MNETDFISTRAWKQINLANGDYRYEKLWFGAHIVDDAMVSFSLEFEDILVEIAFTEKRGPRFFTIPIVRELIMV